MSTQEFWQRVYIAAIATGAGHITAKIAANEAVRAFRTEWD